MSKSKSYWLVKSEPDCFSIHDLAAAPRQTTCWSGVRNYLARNRMRAMKRGDQVLFYHSSTKPMAVVGIAKVTREAYPDNTAWRAGDDHFDPKASAENPIWQMVDLKLKAIFPQPVTLDAMRNVAALKKMELLQRGSRLSVQVVQPTEFDLVVQLGRGTAGEGAAVKAAGNKPLASKTKTTVANKKKKTRKSASGKGG